MIELNEIVDQEYLDKSYKSVSNRITKYIPTKTTSVKPSQWAENKRSMPVGTTDMPGQFSWTPTPYFKEIIDNFSENSNIESIAILKGAQIGYNVGLLENLIGWIIDESPGPSIFTSGDQSMAEANMELRIDKMISSAGIQEKIFAQVDSFQNKKTGNTKSKKEFLGGFLLAIGPNSGSKLRNVSIRYGLFDEIDASFGEIKKEGDFLDIIERRFDAFEDTRKKIYGSTPTELESSRIWRLYQLGDQRKYHVPCKKCGKLQVMNFYPDENGRGGIHYDRKDGKFIRESVHYRCISCDAKWKNSDKTFFLDPKNGAKWIPTAKTQKENHVSYYLPSWYAGIGLRTWESICEEWILSEGNFSKLKVFQNTVVGMPWENRKNAIAYEKVMLRKGGYDSGHLPNDIKPLLITCGVDIQSDRIELEVVAWLRNFESYSLDYRVFTGDTSQLENSPYQDLTEFLSTDYNGFIIDLCFIDSGYRQDIIYQYVSQFAGGVFAIQGDSVSSRKGKGPVFRTSFLSSYGIERIDLYTDILKQEFYGYVQKSIGDGGEIPRGYCHFPSDYTDKIFKMYLSENRVPETTKGGTTVYRWKKIHERNEALDCRVYAMGAVYYLAWAYAQNNNLEYIEWNQFWDSLENGEI